MTDEPIRLKARTWSQPACCAPGCTAVAFWLMPANRKPACDRHFMHGWFTSPPKPPIGIIDFAETSGFDLRVNPTIQFLSKLGKRDD